MGPARRLLEHLGRHRRSFLTGFCCVVCATAVSLAAPWVLKLAVDDLTAAVTSAKLSRYGGLLLVLAAAGGAFRFLTRRIIIGASRDVEYELRNALFAKLQTLEPAYFHRHRTGDLMSRATNDLNAVRMMIGPAVMYSATTGLTFTAAVVLMVSIDAQLTAIALLPLPLVSLIVRHFGSAIHRRFERIQEQFAEISAVVQESLSGVRVVRAYRQEDFEIGRFRRANEEYLRRQRGLIRLQGLYGPSMDVVMGVAAVLVLWLGARAVVAGRISVGELVAFNSYLLMLAWPMIAFGWVTNLLQRGMASWKRILEVFDAEPGIRDAPAPAALASRDQIAGTVEFRHLTFGYGARRVLSDVSFVVPAGTTTAIVGATGSGKSTLLHLIPRLHDPPAGTVFVDGVDVRRIPLQVLRSAVGLVPQEPFLFSTTLAENIAFGGDGLGAAASAIAAAAAVSRLDKDVATFPDGYGTIVGERGITLSGGQRQRTAIARALMVHPRILLLDDALSAVDTHTEEEILGRLADATPSRTTLLVSHRISTVRRASQIVVLHDGRVAELGTHEELLQRDGLYAGLYRRQLLEEELQAS